VAEAVGGSRRRDRAALLTGTPAGRGEMRADGSIGARDYRDPGRERPGRGAVRGRPPLIAHTLGAAFALRQEVGTVRCYAV
jgi:hypothetical protein